MSDKIPESTKDSQHSPLNLHFTAPLPWRIERAFRVSIYDDRGNQVLEISRHAKSDNECEKLAQFIDHAVNSHPVAREMAAKVLWLEGGPIQSHAVRRAVELARKFKEIDRE